ncbi:MULTISPECIES: hypothetical protein [Streptomyces]|uniref:Uncharacterized protein n=1 Tax=Streptomyces galilaeus TaxID=33899 RepID=A0ABW9ITS3_STRGJ
MRSTWYSPTSSSCPCPSPARGRVVPWRPAPALLDRAFQQLPDFRP